MLGRTAPLLASLVFLSGCHLWMPDHTDTKGLPPPTRPEMSPASFIHPWRDVLHDKYETMSWESFIHEPWRDPLHDKYEELFGASFPNPSRRHFATDLPFADVQKYDLAFEANTRGVRSETESGGGEYAVAMQLPDSAGKDVELSTDDENIRLSVVRPLPAGRYRSYRPEETVVPLPTGADPSTARVERDGDWVRIKFRSKNPGRPHAK
jgi:HSP20 family molecular chaperone IbpA